MGAFGRMALAAVASQPMEEVEGELLLHRVARFWRLSSGRIGGVSGAASPVA
jgi:hypothetical protein